jgi:TolA-binding protein
MSLKLHGGNEALWRAVIVVGLFAGMLFLGSCGGSEEATMDSDDAALTSFIGEKPVQEEPSEVSVTEIDRELEELRTENTQLKQKILKLEEDNRTLNTELSDTDLQLMEEKRKADSLARISAMTRVPSSGGAPAAYEEALMDFRARRYDSAIQKLQGLLDAGVEPRYADNCQYWLGECNFAKRNYSRAISNFESVLSTRTSEKKGDAQYMVARCYEQLGNGAQAREAYQTFINNYPTSRLIPRAQSRIAKL